MSIDLLVWLAVRAIVIVLTLTPQFKAQARTMTFALLAIFGAGGWAPAVLSLLSRCFFVRPAADAPGFLGEGGLDG
jgi:hypothetical protein